MSWMMNQSTASTDVMNILSPQTHKYALNYWIPWKHPRTPVPWGLKKAPSNTHRATVCLYVYSSKTAEAAACNSEILRENLQCPLQISVKSVYILQGQHCGQTSSKWCWVKRMGSFLLPSQPLKTKEVLKSALISITWAWWGKSGAKVLDHCRYLHSDTADAAEHIGPRQKGIWMFL